METAKKRLQIEQLRNFGELETMIQTPETYEFKITEGFTGKARETLKLSNLCCEIAPGYPYVKSVRSEVGLFHLILKKEGKAKKPEGEFICGNQDHSSTAEKCSNQCAGCTHRGNNG